MHQDKKRIVLVGGLAPNMFANYSELTMWYKRIAIDELKGLTKDAEVTVKLLSQLLGKELTPNSGLYTWQEGDILIVVGLKRPVRGQEMQVTIDDLDLVMVRVFPGRWIP